MGTWEKRRGHSGWGIKRGLIEKAVFQWRLESWIRGVRLCLVEMQQRKKQWLPGRMSLREQACFGKLQGGKEEKSRRQSHVDVRARSWRALRRHCKVGWILLAIKEPPVIEKHAQIGIQEGRLQTNFHRNWEKGQVEDVEIRKDAGLGKMMIQIGIERHSEPHRGLGINWIQRWVGNEVTEDDS